MSQPGPCRIRSACHLFQTGTTALAPLVDLALRLWIAQIFWRAGLVKIQSMYATVGMFTYIYHVPLLSPTVAAWLGTGVELVFPVLLAAGLLSRFTALVLFLYNIVSVISYPAMGTDNMLQQAGWGLMMLVTMTHGPGTLSLDWVVAKLRRRRSGSPLA